MPAAAPQAPLTNHFRFARAFSAAPHDENPLFSLTAAVPVYVGPVAVSGVDQMVLEFPRFPRSDVPDLYGNSELVVIRQRDDVRIQKPLGFGASLMQHAARVI
jgi:hypothetical protein